jgi:hypothetical protein
MGRISSKSCAGDFMDGSSLENSLNLRSTMNTSQKKAGFLCGNFYLFGPDLFFRLHTGASADKK